MENRESIIAEILRVSLQCLSEHKDPDFPTVYMDKMNPDTEILSLNYADVGTPITDQEAEALLTQAIIQSLDERGKVILYTCEDNGCIAIEKHEDKEQFDYFFEEAQCDTPYSEVYGTEGLEPYFAIAYD